MSGTLDGRAELRADCGRCVGLCCVAPAFQRSADFAIDKPAGRACPNLLADSRCGIHAELPDRGFPGCVVFDCFGAGQQITQQTFRGRDWRSDRATATAMFDAFGVMRELQESRWYLVEATTLAQDPLAVEVGALAGEIAELAAGDGESLGRLDAAALTSRVGAVLERVSEQVRGRAARGKRLRRADLIGARRSGADLTAADLRGAYLLGADLSGADLSRADLLGADLRGADVRGARLATALFLTQPQLASARGDAHTTIPAVLRRPASWPS
jgi:uncharacterized protein YjbI with pentapeptide repeats